jgi:hypothetical protein
MAKETSGQLLLMKEQWKARCKASSGEKSGGCGLVHGGGCGQVRSNS